jgi:hypothetical protein
MCVTVHTAAPIVNQCTHNTVWLLHLDFDAAFDGKWIVIDSLPRTQAAIRSRQMTLLRAAAIAD